MHRHALPVLLSHVKPLLLLQGRMVGKRLAKPNHLERQSLKIHKNRELPFINSGGDQKSWIAEEGVDVALSRRDLTDPTCKNAK